MKEMIKTIENALEREICSGWDRSFLISILSQIEKGKILTHKQKQILGRVIEQNSESEARKLEGWKAEYFSKFQDTAIKISYYHSYYPYYGDMARDILDGKVPRKKKFMKMYNNKYSKKVLNEYGKMPRFKPGEYVKPRAHFEMRNFSFSKHGEKPPNDWAAKRKAFLDFNNRGGIIIAVDNEIHSAARGAKRYKIVCLGGLLPFYVEERHLKRGPRHT